MYSLLKHATVLGVLLVFSNAVNAKTPSSERSRKAVARVESQLKTSLGEKGLKLGSPVFIRLFKQPAVLEVWVKKEKTFHLFRSYKICNFSGELGPKLKTGDSQAPEGFYFVSSGRMNPNSRFHLSFNLGYPNAFDRHHGRTGSALMVHGSCVSIGCYAMEDKPIEEIWTLCSSALNNGQQFFRVHCFPFPMTKGNLDFHKKNVWAEFWQNLKPVYEYFDKHRVPPNVVVKGGRYVIDPKQP